jgi:hypothetical protein
MYRALQKKTYTCSSNPPGIARPQPRRTGSFAMLIRLRRINAQQFMNLFPKVATITRKRLFTSL